MSRLIDADAFIQMMEKKYNHAVLLDQFVLMACRNGIAAMPTIEPKIGKWIKARGSWCTPGGDPVWECSECGKGVHVYGIEHGTYGSDVADDQWVACPNCGADMRSKENEIN